MRDIVVERLLFRSFFSFLACNGFHITLRLVWDIAVTGILALHIGIAKICARIGTRMTVLSLGFAFTDSGCDASDLKEIENRNSQTTHTLASR